MPTFDPHRRSASPALRVDFNVVLIDLLNSADRPAEPFVATMPCSPRHPSSAPVRTAANDVALCDWDALFSAVKERLRTRASQRNHDGSGPWNDPLIAPLERLSADVLDCVQALDQLQDTMRHELERRDRLALEVFDAVSPPMAISNQVVELRPSIGIAVGPSDSLTAEGLLPCAVAAVRRARRDRSGYAFFDEAGAR